MTKSKDELEIEPIKIYTKEDIPNAVNRIYANWEANGNAEKALQQRKKKISEILSKEKVTDFEISMLKKWAEHYDNKGLKDELNKRGW